MRNRTGWQYAAAGLFIAGIAAVISYNDGLFVARLAGNHDRLAYLYPLLPDGLIVISLLSLVECARQGARRSGWATCGLGLGIAWTLAMNTGAGVARSPLDAVLLGMVPVAFMIAAEIVLGHVRRGRGAVAPGGSPAVTAGAVPSDVLAAAKASMAATAAAGNPLSRNQLQERFGLRRSVATEVWAPYQPAKEPPGGASGASGRDVVPPSVPAALNGHAGG